MSNRVNYARPFSGQLRIGRTGEYVAQMQKVTARHPVMTEIAQRIEARMGDLGVDAAKTSRKTGLGKTLVYDIIAGKNLNPSVPVLKAIATALDWSLSDLLGERASPNPVRDPRLIGAPAIPIIGIAEAGTFREVIEVSPEHEDELPTINAPRSKRYPHVRHFAFHVRGDSMNAATPTPILDGMYALCIDVIEAQLLIESGKIYLIRRTIDGGGTFEWTIKRAYVYRGRTELHPESSNQNWKPVIIHRQSEEQDPTEIRAIGLVYGTHVSFE